MLGLLGIVLQAMRSYQKFLSRRVTGVYFGEVLLEALPSRLGVCFGPR